MAGSVDRGQAEIEKIWRRYRETGDRRLRDQLVFAYVPLVRHLAYRKVRELPAWCEVDDLVSNGVEGLIGALDRYDPAKGASLEQFVWTRIQGAVLDSLRRLDWAPRSLRRWERDAERAGEEFFRRRGRRPTDAELAETMGIEQSELDARLRDLAVAELTSLDTVTSSGDEEEGVPLSQMIPDLEGRADPESEATRTIAGERFRRAFSHLSERERRVAVMLYTQGRTLSEIGEVIGVSESRVCQIHGELKKRLRSSLRRDAELFTAAH
jgi:RNA polymerase sigma factor for flagellar operon FliA